MKIAFINIVCTGSTGRIVHDIQEKSESLGYITKTFFGRGNGFKDLPCDKISNILDFFVHASFSTIFGKNGHYSKLCTQIFVSKLKRFNPDVIHIHNIHGFYINFPILFKYLNDEFKGKVIWTLHDNWAITGHCASFSQINCVKWQKECYKCPAKLTYPPMLIDSSKYEYNLKKKLFNKSGKIIFTFPSLFFKNVFNKSFLKDNKGFYISNYVNNKVFLPKKAEEIYLKYGIQKNKKIYLAISNIWSDLKGIDIINKIIPNLNKNELLIIVGKINNSKKIQSNKVLYINQTENQNDLAGLYNISDVQINPSKSESFSLVTLESIFCGTPVIVFDNSAIKELILNENSGKVISYHSSFPAKAFLQEARKFNKKIDKDTLKMYNKKYDKENILQEYINLYNRSEGKYGK